MSEKRFQIRICLNPECGLRYPILLDNQFGERCPNCLGQTVIAVEQTFPEEPIPTIHPSSKEIELCVVLDNIRSGLNVGSIFRSADAFGLRHLYLCGITPTPEEAEVRKSALGAEKYIPWSSHNNAVDLIANLKNQEIKVWALEKTQNSISINHIVSTQQKPKHLILVMGNEVTGVDPGILELADCVTHIPMQGIKRSLNVAAAFSIAAQILRTSNY
jgi:tRNA G18 (ribose-2'-O)-methylase SpoU